MILADGAIRRARDVDAIEIQPFTEEHLNPASYDLTLHHKIMVQGDPMTRSIVMDLREVPGSYMDEATMDPHLGYILRLNEFILASTREVISLGAGMAARVEGKSSLARVGMAVHVTGGFIDPGFSGQVTLEIKNLFPQPLRIYPGMRIAQIAFIPIAGTVERSYEVRGHYQGQEGPTLSRYRIPHLCEPE